MQHFNFVFYNILHKEVAPILTEPHFRFPTYLFGGSH